MKCLKLRSVPNDAAITEDLKSRTAVISASVTVIKYGKQVAVIGDTIEGKVTPFVQRHERMQD